MSYEPTPFRVAAFADGVLDGNPAGVVLSEAFPADAAMQQAAADLGYSETAFVVPASGSHEGSDVWRIRYFTPAVEVELCGHATLASAFMLWREGALAAAKPIRFESPAGPLAAERDEDGTIWLELPSDPPGPPITGERELDALGECLGLQRISSMHRSRYDLLVIVDDERRVTHYQPDPRRIGQIACRGITLTAAAPATRDYDFVSRFFAPRCGILEDPVTGSAHCTLAAFWSARTGKRSLTGYQASDRGGLVHCRLPAETEAPSHVRIGGRARMI